MFPISKCDPKGEWTFIEEVNGTYEEALARAKVLQDNDPEFQYRIWDCR